MEQLNVNSNWLTRVGGRTVLIQTPIREFSVQGQGALIGNKTKKLYSTQKWHMIIIIKKILCYLFFKNDPILNCCLLFTSFLPTPSECGVYCADKTNMTSSGWWSADKHLAGHRNPVSFLSLVPCWLLTNYFNVKGEWPPHSFWTQVLRSGRFCSESQLCP